MGFKGCNLRTKGLELSEGVKTVLECFKGSSGQRCLQGIKRSERAEGLNGRKESKCLGGSKLSNRI